MGRTAAAVGGRVSGSRDSRRREGGAAVGGEALAGCADAEEIADRGAAIAAAIGGLRAGDVLVIAGKGHEAGQTTGDETVPFDDAEVARQAVAALRSNSS